MRLRVAISALALALLVPGSAAAATTTWVVNGAGFGHGVGMSQYGAWGFARHGWNYAQILAWYYKGTRIGSAPRGSIRVLLMTGKGSISVSDVKQVNTRRLDPNQAYTAKVSGGGVTLRDSHHKVAAHINGPAQVWDAGHGVRLGGTALNGVTNGRYRGAIELRAGPGGVMAINYLGLDDYIQGVVPGEMPSLWSPEALKAQAVAARSYALATDVGGALFDQYPDTRSQMYEGMSGETASTNVAVRDTAGQVVTYHGNVATTYFFSTSGGKTEDVQNVFYSSAPVPYLKGVSDPYEGNAPRHRWRLTFSQSQIDHRLGGLCRGHLKAVKILQRGVSPRIVKASVVCTKSTRTVTGTQLRAVLGTYDTWFTVTKTRSRVKPKTDALAILVKALL